jgi:hypothetical protein
MSAEPKLTPSGETPMPPARRVLVALAVGTACAFVGLLGVRTLTTPDLGYHLAYGDHFLETGRIVDRGLFMYDTPDLPPDTTDLGPGCWYDDDGSYRFPNANWLSQVVMAVVHRAAGLEGLSGLLAALVGGIFAVGIVTFRRLGVGWLGTAAGMILMAMVAYERFLIRPEVFGYLVLAGQFCLLARGRVSRRAAAGLVALQLLLVNLHGYFLLGLALTGAVLAERLLRLAWGRLRAARGASPPAGSGDTGRIALVLAGQVAACFVNPWTWRLAALPVQTLLFIRQHDIAVSELTLSSHPWAHIGEFFRPFSPGVVQNSKATYAYCVLLGLSGAGAVAATARRRWAHLLILAGMTAVSLSMRRNIAPAALILVPAALAACRDAVSRAAGRLGLRRPAGATLALAGVLILAGVYGCLSVVTQRFYRDERMSVRFGLGLTPSVFPIGPAEWINAHRPTGRMWTDYNTSSNLHYFTRPHRLVPILTNTWAYRPAVMRRSLDCTHGRRAFAAETGAQIVVIQVGPRIDPRYRPLGRQLADDANWALVYLDSAHALFLRADGANAELACREAITPQSIRLDLGGFVRKLRSLDPISSHSAYLGGYTLSNLGWYTPAIEVYRQIVAEDPYPHRVWTQIGWCLVNRGRRRMHQTPPDHRGRTEDWPEARRCFQRALDIRPDYKPARTNLHLIEQEIAAERRGILYPED